MHVSVNHLRFLLSHSFIFTSRSNLKGVTCLDKPPEITTGLMLLISILQLIILAHNCTVFIHVSHQYHCGCSRQQLLQQRVKNSYSPVAIVEQNKQLVSGKQKQELKKSEQGPDVQKHDSKWMIMLLYVCQMRGKKQLFAIKFVRSTIFVAIMWPDSC